MKSKLTRGNDILTKCINSKKGELKLLIPDVRKEKEMQDKIDNENESDFGTWQGLKAPETEQEENRLYLLTLMKLLKEKKPPGIKKKKKSKM